MIKVAQDINHIKKLLYKQKPNAEKFTDNGEEMLYDAILQDEANDWQVFFNIPVSEGAEFGDVMQAQLLIRWYDEAVAISNNVRKASENGNS